MRTNNSKLNFTTNHRASWFSRGWLKISKQSISPARLGECSKSKVTPLFSGKIGFINILQNLPENVCLFKLDWTITDTISWNDFLTYSQLILLYIHVYYFHQKKLKEKPTIKYAASLTLSVWSSLFSYHLLCTRKPGLCIAYSC